MMKQILRSFITLIAFQFSYSHLIAADTVRVVALRGQQAPGVTDGAKFSRVLNRGPVLNNSGQVVFRAILSGTGVNSTNDIGIWSEGRGALELVSREGNLATNFGPGASYLALGYPLLTDLGEVYYYGSFRENTNNVVTDKNFISNHNGMSGFYVKAGDPVPGYNEDFSFNISSSPNLIASANGNLAIHTTMLEFGSAAAKQGIWTNQFGIFSTVASTQTQAPGQVPNMNFNLFNSKIYEFAVSPNGQIAYGASGPSSNVLFSGIWLHSDKNLQLIALSNQQAVGLPSGTRMTSFEGLSLNSKGKIAYRGEFTDGNPLEPNNQGIWLYDDGITSLVLRSGQQTPGLAAGVTFGDFVPDSSTLPQTLAINTTGEMIIECMIQGSDIDWKNNSTIWKRDLGGNLHLIARQGEQAVGLPTGYAYGGGMYDAGYSTRYFSTLNNAGQIAFHRNYTSLSTGMEAGSGIWALDRTGEVRLIVATGQPFEIAPGDSRVVTEILFQGGGNTESGHRNAFNDRGQLAFYAAFTDGSAGIFVSNLVAVPEPGALVLIGIPALGMLLRRR
jgi:hypothetical protein